MIDCVATAITIPSCPSNIYLHATFPNTMNLHLHHGYSLATTLSVSIITYRGYSQGYQGYNAPLYHIVPLMYISASPLLLKDGLVRIGKKSTLTGSECISRDSILAAFEIHLPPRSSSLPTLIFPLPIADSQLPRKHGTHRL